MTTAPLARRTFQGPGGDMISVPVQMSGYPAVRGDEYPVAVIRSRREGRSVSPGSPPRSSRQDLGSEAIGGILRPRSQNQDRIGSAGLFLDSDHGKIGA